MVTSSLSLFRYTYTTRTSAVTIFLCQVNCIINHAFTFVKTSFQFQPVTNCHFKRFFNITGILGWSFYVAGYIVFSTPRFQLNYWNLSFIFSNIALKYITNIFSRACFVITSRIISICVLTNLIKYNVNDIPYFPQQ